MFFAFISFVSQGKRSRKTLPGVLYQYKFFQYIKPLFGNFLGNSNRNFQNTFSSFYFLQGCKDKGKLSLKKKKYPGYLAIIRKQPAVAPMRLRVVGRGQGYIMRERFNSGYEFFSSFHTIAEQPQQHFGRSLTEFLQRSLITYLSFRPGTEARDHGPLPSR